MTSTDACAHWRTLLPWYTAGTLPDDERAAVDRHLASCHDCACELASWRALAETVRAEGDAIVPALALDDSWAMFAARLPAAVSLASVISAPAHVSRWNGAAQRLLAAVAHLAQVIIAQVRVLRPIMWIASAVGIVLAALYAATRPHISGETDVLAVALPLICAAGAAFLYGPETDRGLELALATPTSPRAVLFGRFALLFTFDAALALATTVALAALRGVSLWSLATYWLGPMALLGGISLAVSMLAGPAVAAGAALVFWLSRLVQLGAGATLALSPPQPWPTTPPMLALALGLVVATLLLTPRRERLATDADLA